MIIYSQKFHQSIEELVEILFVKQYFSFIDDCQVYVSKIYDFIDDNISKPINTDTPIPLIMFGEKYIRYKANNQTFWYIFFDQKGDHIIINHITNNHSPDFTELM